MKIDLKILSIPPYISTPWKNIAALHMENLHTHPVLVVELSNGSRVEIPHLDRDTIEKIYAAHQLFVEHGESSSEQTNITSSNRPRNVSIPNESSSIPLQIGIEGIDAFGSMLQHNPEQAQAPDLPSEVLNKIAAISKVVGVDDNATIPKAEPHCNCMHCQIARAIQKAVETTQPEPEKLSLDEVVSDKDLCFREWDIEQTGNNLYCVSNPFDKDEQYTVFLGEPIGCTCGEKNCPHILAVLQN